MFSPISQGIKKSSKNFKTSFTKGVENIKTSKFVTNVSAKLAKAEESLNKTTLGKALVTGIKYIGKSFETVGKFISKIGSKIKDFANKMTYEKHQKQQLLHQVQVLVLPEHTVQQEKKLKSKNENDEKNDFSSEVEDYNDDLAKDEI